VNSMIIVQLSNQPVPAIWGDGSVVSTQESGITIHLKGKNNHLTIQQGARAIAVMGVQQCKLVGADWNLEAQWNFHQGFWSHKNQQGVVFAEMDKQSQQQLQNRIKAYQWAKNQIHATPEDLSPLNLAQEAATFICQIAPDKVSYEILSGDELAEKGYVGIHGVGRGSERPPALLTLDYNPSSDSNAPVSVALVGKGITFDSGGYSLKASETMFLMKIDMGGAATITAALALAMLNGLNKRVKLILCCAENLVSGHAYKLGDILTYRNGVSVEIANTDAEGRLVLADGLIDATASGAKLIVDAATLTGAAMVAVGSRFNALFSLDQALMQRYLSYANQEQEYHWPLPLETWHADECPSSFADTQNSRPVKGGGVGGASNAAGFLSRFVDNDQQTWLHIDLAGVYLESANKYAAAGATGLGIKTLARALIDEAL